MKHCPKCNQNKPYSSFSKSTYCKDGHCTYCKECQKKYRRRYYPNKHKSRGAVRKTKSGKLMCSKCKTYLHPNQFHKSKKSKTGCVSKCKHCSKTQPTKYDKFKYAKCTLCHTVQELSMFRPSNNKRGHTCRCIKCLNKAGINTGNLSCEQSNKYKYYYKRAISKSLDFYISPEEFRSLVCKPCHYCGIKENIGLDRYNNDNGYTISNCVPCCSKCNMAKYTQTYEEFIALVKSVYVHLNLGKL